MYRQYILLAPLIVFILYLNIYISPFPIAEDGLLEYQKRITPFNTLIKLDPPPGLTKFWMYLLDYTAELGKQLPPVSPWHSNHILIQKVFLHISCFLLAIKDLEKEPQF